MVNTIWYNPSVSKTRHLPYDKGRIALFIQKLNAQSVLTVHSQHPNSYFWRTHDQAEIDLIEEQNGILNAYEIKWKENKVKFLNSFLEAYPENTTSIINLDNFSTFISK